MKNSIIFLLTLGFIIILSSCTPIYFPAINGSTMPYQARTAYFEEDQHKTWVSGSVHQGQVYSNNRKENNQFVQGAIHQSHTVKNLKASYGGFAYAGSYQGYRFQGLGLRGSFNACISYPRIDFNVIGVQGGYTQEIGEYHESLADFHGTPTLNLTTGFDLKLKNRSSLGLELGAGSTGLPLSINYTSQRFYVWSQVNLLTWSVDTQNKPIIALGAGFNIFNSQKK